MATGLRLVTERAGDGAGQPVLDTDNGEELMHVQPGVSIVLGNRRRPPESPGTLYITTKQVVWLSDTDRARGYAVDFISVSLHAVSRDPEAYPSPCIYTQSCRRELATALEHGECVAIPCQFLKQGGLHVGRGIENEDEEDELEDSDTEGDGTLNLSKITEMRLVPSDPNQLDTLFSVFCECAELNPDFIEEEEGEHNWVFSANQLEYEAAEDDDSEWAQNPTHSIGANGNLDLANSVVQLQINDQRFEDADEMEHDDKNGHH